MPATARTLHLAALFALATLVVLAAGTARAGEGKTKEVEKDKTPLPRVLLIGDSISIGYTPVVTKALAGKANVIHNKGNAQDTRHGVAQLKDWLGGGKWDVIHFNWGLWDLKNGAKAVPLEDYEKNLRELVSQLKETKATLIWASTTPVPEGAGMGRRSEDVLAYNAAAKKIMDEHKIPIDDLYALALPQLDALQQPKNVHFAKEGNEALGAKVTEAIQAALKGK